MSKMFSTMNVLKRSITSKLSLSDNPSTKLRFLLYSTTYTLNPPKPPRRSQKPIPKPFPTPSSSSSSSSEATEAVKFPDLPRPSEIPYQAKVANLVNLIGHVRAPVKFLTAPDGKNWASTVINQDNDKERSCLIPVVFEGDLAHIATVHVKENDCVYVNGRLCEEPLPFLLGEISLKLHLRVENINFVQGFEEQRNKKKFGRNASSSYEHRDGTVMASKEEEKEKVEEYKSDFSIKKGSKESIVASPVSVKYKKDEDEDSPAIGADPWRDLVQNSMEWLDYRDQKFKGLLSNKYPDFRHKDTGVGLWLGSAPGWVLGGLASLEFGVPPPPRQKQSKDAKEDLWRSLVENPSEWWDNRLNKKNPRAPDFKHKINDQALWLGNSTPGWVLSKLPPSG